MSEASYEELVQQLTDFNVALTTVNGEYRSTYDIMYDIAQQWSKMTSMEQAALATAMSGTRQQAVFYSIIEQFQEATGAMDAMSDSAGELQKSYDIYMESTTAHINQFKAAFQELGADTFTSDFLQQFIDMGTHTVEFLDGLMELIDALGGLNTVLYTTVGLISIVKADAIWSKLKKIGNGIAGLYNNIANLTSGTTKLCIKANVLEGELDATAVSANTAAVSISAAQIAIAAIVAVIGIAAIAISTYNQKLQENIDKYKNLVDAYNEASDTYESNIESLQRLKDEYIELSKGVDENGNNVSLTSEEYERYLDIINEIIQVSPNVCNGYDNEGNAIVNYKNVLNEAIAAQEQWLENQKQIYLSSGNDLFKGIESAFKSSDNASSDFTNILGNLGIATPPPTYGHADQSQVAQIEKQLENARAKAEEFRNALDSIGVSFDDLYNKGSSKYSMDKLFAVTNLADHLDVFLNLLKETGNYSEETLIKIENSILSADAQAQSLIQTVQDGVDFLYLKLENSDLYSEWFNLIPIDALDEFKNGLKYVVDPFGTYTDNLMNAARYGEEFSNAIKDDSAQQIISLSNAMKFGKVSLSEFNEAVALWKASFAGSEEVMNAILDFFEALSNVANNEAIAAPVEDLSQKLKSLNNQLHDTSDMLGEMKKGKDILADAAEEMKENGEISNDTVQAIAEMMDEGEDWLQYLKIENGQIKLNTELWKERILSKLEDNIATLDEELTVLQQQDDELINQLSLLETRKKLLSGTVEKDPNNPFSMFANIGGSNIRNKSNLPDNIYPGMRNDEYGQTWREQKAKENEIADTKKRRDTYKAMYDSWKSDIESVVRGEEKLDEETRKTFDWISTMLDRIQRKVNEFSRVVGSKFKSLSTRNEAAKKEIEAITEEIELQEKAYRKYIELCETMNLSDEIKQTIQNGAIDISEYDEETAELISQYQEWYEAALDTKDAVDELHESLASMYDDEFNRIQTDFENRISLLEYLSNMYNTGISQLETEGYMASAAFYESLTEATEHNIELLKEELDSLEGALQAALDSGEIEMYSEAWYGYITTMNGVKEAIADANLSLAEFAKTMQEIDWEYFDYLQERISNITDESEFLLDLLGEDNIFKDGKLTAEGLSALGLRAMDYNVYMAQADKYAQEIAEIEQQLANDPNNRTLLDRREELLELQRQSILAAEDEKDAILDLVQTAIEEELDSIKELIEAYKDALDAAKDLYDYRNKIADETSEIASLQKQLSAYSGDNSEEARATIQQLKDQLVKAQKELEETEYDKYISDQKKLLDNLYAEYELLLNQRMDNTDALLADIIAMVNQNANVISDTLHMTADSVGYTLTDSMQTVWSSSFNSLQNVVTMYGEGFLSQLTTTNQAINNIASLVANMQAYSNSWANSWIGGVNNSYTPDISGWTPGGYTGGNTGGGYDDWDTEIVDDGDTGGGNSGYTPPAPTPTKQIQIGGLINAGSAPIYDYAGDTTGERQYYRDDPIYRVLNEKNGYLLTRWYKLSNGYTGWFKRSDVKAYKHGGLVDETGLMWLDGTKQNPEAVLNSEQTERFIGLTKAMEKLAKNGIDFSAQSGISAGVVSKLIGGRAEITPIGGSYGGYTQDVQITIPIDHVFDYDDFISQLVRDKNGRRIIRALALDPVAGKNNLSVNKFIK